MKLRCINYRRLAQKSPSEWTDAELMQIDAITAGESFQHFRGIHREKFEDGVEGLDDDLADWEYNNAEVVDVVDENEEMLFQLHVFGYGSAYLFEAGTDDQVGGADSNQFEMDDDEHLESLAAAYGEASFEQEMNF